MGHFRTTRDEQAKPFAPVSMRARQRFPSKVEQPPSPLRRRGGPSVRGVVLRCTELLDSAKIADYKPGTTRNNANLDYFPWKPPMSRPRRGRAARAGASSSAIRCAGIHVANRASRSAAASIRRTKRSGVQVDALTSMNSSPEIAIRRAASAGRYDLVVLGASLHVGDKKFLGPGTEALVRGIKIPIILVAQ
jgi:nucleotide-binding universal stress UspA family protein